MSLSSTLSNALSGLTATSRAADMVASNIANARTEGYGVRRLVTTPQVLAGQGSGVRVLGVERLVDPHLIATRRGAEAAQSEAQILAQFSRRIETAIGAPNSAQSLSAHITEFEAHLIAAANQPDSQSRLAAVLSTAERLTAKLNTLSDTVQTARHEADRTIARDVAQVNQALEQIHRLNTQIRSNYGRSGDVSALLDRQQALIDSIAPLIPLRETRNATGQVSLYSADGIALLDSRPAVLSFDPTAVMSPDLRIETGGLSGLRVNDRPIDMSGGNAGLQGGGLAAQFALRDQAAPAAQAQIDALARDLISRFEDPALDPSRTSATPGLFTDAGTLFDPAFETGLAGRVRVNTLVSPAEGGAIWRLRDGLGASAPGPTGDARLLTRMADALSASTVTQSGGFTATGRSLPTLAGELLSRVATDRQAADATEAYTTSQYTTFRAEELRTGVDSDREMQELLLIEQAFAANAKVIEAAENMLDQLMRI